MFSLFDLFILMRVPRVGPARLRSLVDHCGTPSRVRSVGPENIRKAPGWSSAAAEAFWAFLRRDEQEAARFAEAQISSAERAGARIVTLWDEGYPELLARIDDPPLALFVRGETAPEDRFAIGIVGTRRPTPYGRAIASRLAAECAAAGMTVVSGLARGIDTVAHRSALQSSGRTFAVIGSGLDVVYPPENAPLSRLVERSGALLTEFPMGTKPEPGNFPRRNRLISGLSLGVIVVESDLTGGAMITAKCALDQNREVYAVPGRVDAPMSRGCNELIRQSRAKLVEHVREIIEDLAPVLRQSLLEAGRSSRAVREDVPSLLDGFHST